MTEHCRHRGTPPRDERPRLPDGALDVRAWCAQLDADANRGAGKPRDEDLNP